MGSPTFNAVNNEWYVKLEQQQQLFYSHCTGCVSCHAKEELKDFVGAKFYCMHALAGGNQCSWIREKR